MMKKLAVLLGVLTLVGVAGADNYAALGYSEDTVIQSDMGDQCVGVPIYNHDMSFENGYCWQYGGIVPPYYGAFAEGFDLGAVNVECGLFWLTQIGYYYGQTIDVYVWDGGVYGPPTGVLCVVPGVTGLNVGYWPSCTMNDIEIGCCVTGDFSVGAWGNWPGQSCAFYYCADENGFGGFPWTNIAPGIGYPTGWNNVNVVFSGAISMGFGATIDDHPSAPESRTWGAIKGLFGK
ncbi:MAG: hypothetical protein FJ313_08330 [Gemmatimonadetes bacterium]|nr:hypothetical protein [Gemmatimonadota bacterium]